MINFLNSKLSPKVVCKSPATDNYEIENLISETYANKIRGFIAYPSIKPPVEIEFEFICPTNIHFIVVDSTVGTQKCTGIEVFATSQDQTVSIAKAVYEKEKIGVYFCNSRKYSVTNPPNGFNPDLFHIAFFKSTTFRNFLNAASVKLVIFRTDKSVPCLKSVEIWGTPSKFCSATTVRTINHLMQTSKQHQVRKANKKEFSIPEDFKDDLTYEIMTVPMTLPSGKTVDQSTLDKHIMNETSFGRKPGDPFTGIKFSEKVRPVLNVALKSRIDMFLLQHSGRSEISGLKRTLGGSRPNNSKIAKKTKTQNSDDTLDELDKVILEAKASSSFSSCEERKISCSTCEEHNQLYLLPCTHYFCRTCLLEICNELKCSDCKTSFARKDVKKWYM